MKLHTQIIALLVLSLVAIGVYHCCPRTEQIDCLAGDWEVDTDPQRGFIKHKISDRGLEVDFSIADRLAKRTEAKSRNRVFIALMIQPKNDRKSADFSWMEKIRLRAYLKGKEQEDFRLHLSNRVPGVTVEDDNISRMFNEVSFRLTSKPRTIEIDRKYFKVPAWWTERYDVPLAKSGPTFDQTEFAQFFAVSDKKEGDYQLIIEEMTVAGHWIPTVVLYRTLLLLWLVLAFGVALDKTLKLRHVSKSTREREDHLLHINQSLKIQTDELAELAEHDPLTGLLNRYGFRHHVATAALLASEANTPMSLILFDIDHFKQLNDTKGHCFGDKVLSRLGKLLLLEEVESESIGRWGGEEFIVICNNSDLEQARFRAEELARQIRSNLEITCSFGVAAFDPNKDLAAAVRSADKALYRAKDLGRDRVEVFRSGTRPLTNDGTRIDQ